ncbi:hypothetical protein GCM10010388_63360 [Streptomyces mauvecolor]
MTGFCPAVHDISRVPLTPVPKSQMAIPRSASGRAGHGSSSWRLFVGGVASVRTPPQPRARRPGDGAERMLRQYALHHWYGVSAGAAFMRAAQAASGRDLAQFWEKHRIRAHDS